MLLPNLPGDKLTKHAKHSMSEAEKIAKKSNDEEIRNTHLFFAIYLEKGSMGSVIMHDLGIEKKHFAPKKPGKPQKMIRRPSPQISANLKSSLARAHATAKKLNYGYVGTEHLVYAILESRDPEIKKIIARVKNKKANLFSKRPLENSLLPDDGQARMSFFPTENMPDIFPSDLGAQDMQSLKEILSGSLKGVKTPERPSAAHIQKFCENMTQKAARSPEILIGREKEIGRMIDILSRKTKNNPLLIGSPGVGKTAIVMGLAALANSGSAPAGLAGKTIMSLDVASLVAGTSFRGEFESRLKEIVREAAQNKNIILFIDELHNIIGAGNSPGSLDLANIIKPALARGEIRLIGATTFSEYKKHIEKDAALDRRFQSVIVKEPGLTEAKEIILGIKPDYEKFHNLTISRETAELAVELSDRYIKNRHLPDKAIDIIDEAAARLRSQNRLSGLSARIRNLEEEIEKLSSYKEKLVDEENYEKAIEIKTLERKERVRIGDMKAQLLELEKDNRLELKPADIIQAVSRISGVPEEKLALAKNEKIRQIEKTLSLKIIGQKQAIKKIAGALHLAQAGLGNMERPLGSFLFLGPTGVGKTLTAKTLAREFFGGGDSLIRIDMSELAERHSLSSLIGSPAGYVGFGEGGRLTEKVRRNPYSVILFDEIEKAHPDIMNIFLQILEEGKLTDAEGLEADFKNTIIILTTNIGTEQFTQNARIGFSHEDGGKILRKFEAIKDEALGELEKHIRPEILARLDDILVFDALGEKELHEIFRLEKDQLEKSLGKQGIELDLKKNAAELIVKKSFDIKKGGRLIRKNVRDLIENPIAEMIVFGKVKNGRIKAEAKNGKIVLR